MVSIRTTVHVNADTASMLAKISGMTDKRMGEFADDIVATAKQNASGLEFKESEGDLAEKIRSERIDVREYRIETYSGHASYIEFGTRFIDGKKPFLWPAYRSEKKKFFKSGPWV